VATVLAWVLLLTCVLGVVGAPVLVWLLASGLRQSPDSFEAAVLMTRWMFPYIGFMSMVALSAGVLNTWKRFAVPAATPVLLNLCMIAAAWLGAPQLAAGASSPSTRWPGGDAGWRAAAGGADAGAAPLGLLPRIGWRWARCAPPGPTPACAASAR
jgi:putative peptidoglycan lipid II flippase